MIVPSPSGATPMLTPRDRDGMRLMEVSWVVDGTVHVAEITRIGDILKLVRYSVENPAGLPNDDRHVPTESRVLGMVRDLGEEAWMYWFHLMGETFRYEGELPDLTPEMLLAYLNAHQRELFRKPHSRRPELIEEAMAMEERGVRAIDIVNALVSKGVSTPTAWRYLKRARAALSD